MRLATSRLRPCLRALARSQPARGAAPAPFRRLAHSDSGSGGAEAEYSPAQNWNGLEWVGSPEWKASRRREQREPLPEVFPAQPLRLSPAAAEAAVQLVVREVSGLAEAGLLDRIVALPFPAVPAEATALADGWEARPVQAAEAEAAIEAVVAQSESVDESWRAMSLADAPVKFAIARRFLQVTGHIVPDAFLLSGTAGELAEKMVTRAGSRKRVAEVLTDNPEVSALPNVTIHHSRQTLVEKETEVGRWKVIEGELSRMGLPVRPGE